MEQGGKWYHKSCFRKLAEPKAEKQPKKTKSTYAPADIAKMVAEVEKGKRGRKKNPAEAALDAIG